MKKILSVVMVLAVVAGMVFAQGANEAAEKKVYELKISTSQPEKGMITRSYQKLADALNEKSGGRLSVAVYPAGQLGSDEDVLEQAIQGVNVAVNTDASRMGQYVKDFSILMMGYFANDYDECYKITQTDTFKGWVDTLAKDYGIKILSFTFYDGPRHFITKVPINSPKDLKGLRIRTIGQQVCTETVAALGGTPVSMPPGEVYNAIETKAIDGTEIQNTSSYPYRLYEVCGYQSKTGHFQLMQGLICGQKWFSTLPEDLQKLLVETSVEIGKETSADVIAECDKAEQAMVDAGMVVIKPDLKPFKDAVAGVYDKLGYAELRAKLYKEIGKTE